MKLLRLQYLSMLALVVLLAACGGSGSKETETASESAEFDEAKSQIISDINKVIKDLPPPSEVPYLLMATGSDYDPELVNRLDNIDSYSNPTSKAALNLGVLTSDIGYLTSYEKAQESLEYVSACQKLAEAIGIGSSMDLELISRFERNLSSKDSLKVLVDEVILRANDRLGALDRMSIAGLVLAGSYIEGLYISTALIQNYPDDLPAETRNLILEPLIKIVIDQKPALDDLIVVLGELGDEAAIVSMQDDLNKLKMIYEGELSEVSKQISENTGSLVLETSVLGSLTTETQRIRAKITE
ncbi:MAG: hypothetical protein JXQ90_13115 [Cyclobacteriaceae bacterium]